MMPSRETSVRDRGPTGRRTVLVTGASSGIGKALAEQFAANGYDLIVTARREQRLHTLAERVRQAHGARVEVIACDLAEPGAVEALCACIERSGMVVDGLVNSAGFGVPGRFAERGWAEHAAMLQLMVVAPSELVHRLLPGMIERRHGLILNVSSLAGLVDSGAGALYGAAKSYITRLSVSLAREVGRHDIRVTTLCPGLTRTGFHERPDLRASVSSMPGWMWTDPEEVARLGYAALMSGTPVVVVGRLNRLLVSALRLVPRAVVSALGRSVMRAYRQARR